MPAIGFHPHSGIETVTVVLQGQLSYQETSGTEGVIDEGGVEWMRAGGGVWHSGGPVGVARIKGYQLWIALPPEEENSDSEARYVDASRLLEKRAVQAAAWIGSPTSFFCTRRIATRHAEPGRTV